MLLLVTGAAYGAHALDLVPWLRSVNGSTALFTVDRMHVYRGPAPYGIRCPGSGPGEFECTGIRYEGPRRRVYLLHGRAHAYPLVTRASVIEEIVQNKRAGAIPPARADQMLRDASSAGDDFFERENVNESVRGFFGSESVPGHPSMTYAPPSGVPASIVCDSVHGARLVCHDLRGSENVPADAPIYALPVGSDWVKKPIRSQPRDRERFIRDIFGRALTPAEQRLLASLSLLLDLD